MTMKRASKRKNGSKNKSSSRSVTRPPSIFVVANHITDNSEDFSILQLETLRSSEEKKNGDGDDVFTGEFIFDPLKLTNRHTDGDGENNSHNTHLKEQVVRFKVPTQCQDAWMYFSVSKSSGDLYMLPIRSRLTPLQAYQFHFRTASFQQLHLPISSKSPGYAINLKGRIYSMEHPESDHYSPDSSFECYDPSQGSWKALKRFPDPPLADDGFYCCRIVAAAVWNGDTILYNMASLSYDDDKSLWMTVDRFDLWAYDVCGNEWYKVDVEENDRWCCSIIGEAVVRQDTIYAFTDVQFHILVALSIEKNKTGDGDLVYKCSLLSRISMPGMEPIIDREHAWTLTRHLVHLGEGNFCIVQSCETIRFRGFQPLRLTYMKLEGGKMRMVDECNHELKIQPRERFQVILCFSLPKCMTRGVEGKKFDFELDLVCEDEEDEGRSIYVKNLPRNANVTQVEMGLKKEFGPIKRGGIQLGQTTRGICYANVEFESATSKQRAIKASTIRFGNRLAKILEK